MSKHNFFISDLILVEPEVGDPCLTLSLLVPCWAGDNTDLPSNSNISKTVKVNNPLTRTFLKEYWISFLMTCELIDFALVVLKLLIFKVCGIIDVSKIEFFNFSGTERVNQNKKNNQSKPTKLVSQSLFK